MRTWTCLLLVGLLCPTGLAQADTWLVDAAGTGDFTSIQEAVDAAAPYDRIEILAGSYVEAVDLADKPLDLVGLDGPAMTRIEGVAIGLQAAANPGSSVSGLTITGCEHGAFVHSYSMVTFTDMVFESNDTMDSAGGMAVTDGAFVHVAWSEFLANTAANTAGAVLVMSEGLLYLQETALEDNEASSSGGAVSLMDSATMMTSECVFDGNVAGISGGAIYAESSAALLTGSAFTNNIALDPGGAGGAIAASGSWVDLENGTVMYNEAGMGGGLAAGDGQLQVGNSLIKENTAAESGGGIVGMALQLVILDSTVEGNSVSAADGYGGGAMLMDGEFGAYNTWFSGNSAASGAGLIALGGLVEMWNCRMVENQGGMGIGALGILDAEIWLQNNDFVDNQGSVDHLFITEDTGTSSGALFNTHLVGGVGAAICDESSGGVEIVYNDFWDTTYAFACNHAGLTPQEVGEGNLTHDPEFVAWTADGDLSNDDLHLQAGSASIDAGHPDAGVNDPDGSRSDIGSYGGLASPEDADGDGSTVLGGDCDDDNPDVFPGAPEICDGLDNNCDGEIPEEETFDGDGDGFPECDDCADDDAGVNGDAIEECEDEIDNDCDGLIDMEDPDCQGDDDDDDDATDDDDASDDDDDDDDAGDDDIEIAEGDCKCTVHGADEPNSPTALLLLTALGLGLYNRRRIDILRVSHPHK